MRVTRAGWGVRARNIVCTNVPVECSSGNRTAFLAERCGNLGKIALKLWREDGKWVKRVGLSGAGKVVENTQGEGKSGENWVLRVALGGECPWHGLADKGLGFL
jgi:hypothetical protein